MVVEDDVLMCDELLDMLTRQDTGQLSQMDLTT